MSDSPYVTILNDYSDVRFEERERKSGKKHVTLSISTEPIFVDLDPIALGKGPAEAIAKAIGDGIKAITEVAATGTVLTRKYAADAFAKGKTWATKRYSGGRTGATPPNQSDRFANDSGRLANGITANQNMQEKSWTINVPANRFDPASFSGAQFQQWLDKLYRLVPALQKPLDQPAVREAISRGIDEAIQKGVLQAMDEQARLKLQRIKAGLGLAKQVIGAVF